MLALANLFHSNGQYEKAIPLFEQAIPLLESFIEDNRRLDQVLPHAEFGTNQDLKMLLDYYEMIYEGCLAKVVDEQ